MNKKLIIFILYLFCSHKLISQLDTTTIAFTGDVMLARGIEKNIESIGRNSYFDKFKKYFVNTDFGIVNFECSINHNFKSVNKKYNFNCKSENLIHLKKIGITHLNLANNHSFDFGSCGLLETINETIQNKLIPIGYSKDSSNLYSPEIIENKGNKIALFSAVVLKLENYLDSNCCVLLNQDLYYKLHHKINEYKKHHPKDLVIVLLHWGEEEVANPSKSQIKYAQMLVDNGADLIVGCGSHTLQEFQDYKNKRIYFSLGDFIFDRKRDQGGMLQIKLVHNKIVDYNLINCFP